MNFDDFLAPKLINNHGISSNASVRSTTTTSKLSLSRRNGRLSVSNRGGNTSYTVQCDSQRLSPPPSDLWVSEPSATSTPKYRSPFLHNFPNRKELPVTTRTLLSPSGSTKENTRSTPLIKRKTTKSKNVNNVNTERNINVQSIFKSPEKLPQPVFPVFTSPVKNINSNKAPSIASSSKLSEPSPSKSRHSRVSTVIDIESKGFCPICQVPFACINVISSVHSDSCHVPVDSPECVSGKNCKSTNFHHYRDFRHSVLAEERSEEKALAGSDNSDVDVNLDAVDIDLDNISVHIVEGNKRKLNGSNDTAHKRTKNNHIDEKSTPPDENCNPFFSPSVFKDNNEKSRADGVPEDEPNPFIDAVESESAGGEDHELEKDRENETGHQQEEIGEIIQDNEESSLPCVPGVCDIQQLAVTVTMNGPKGIPVKVQGIGGPDGWKKVEGADEINVSKCRCHHNLHLECQLSQKTQPEAAALPPAQLNMRRENPLPGSSAKSLWAPLMRKMSSSASSVSSISTSSSSSSSSSSLSDRKCPYYKLIPGTRFAVDAFNHGNVPGVKYYFLSHFHYDHYIGLTSKWNNVIYCSAITARLVKLKLKVREELLRVIAVDETTKVDGVMVTALDANHCPGSLMLLYQLSDGTNHLHTGDFRASPHMESYSAFWNLDVQNLYLDTTYCNKDYDFPTQEEVVQWAAERAEVNAAVKEKCLFVCGSYTIGKEKVFIAIAEKLDCKIWAPSQKLQILKALEDPRITKRLTTKMDEARVHVLALSMISIKGMQDHLLKLRGKFTEIIAFKPSGWQYSGVAKKLEQTGNITLCGLPYSEHSSFSELKRFVQFLRPRQVIPTVRSKNCSWSEVKSTCQQWLNFSKASLNKAYENSNPKNSLLNHWKKK